MFCRNCGTNLPEGAAVCPSCGTAAQAPAQQPVAQPVQQPVAQPVQQPVYQQPVQQPVYQQPVQQPVYTVDPATAATLSKGDGAKGFGIAGIITGLLIPLLGFIFGGIAISRANKALAIADDQKYKTGKNLGVAAVIVAAINWVLGMVMQYSNM